MREATELDRRDRGNSDANQRVRFGMYFFQDSAPKLDTVTVAVKSQP